MASLHQHEHYLVSMGKYSIQVKPQCCDHPVFVETAWHSSFEISQSQTDLVVFNVFDLTT